MKHFRNLKLLAAALLAALVATGATAEPAKLPAYGADRDQTSVSGLSSGAYMAVQLQVAYSNSIVGSGIVAGGPYYCAGSSYGSILFPGALTLCMGQAVIEPSLDPIILAAKLFESGGSSSIDPLSNLLKRRIYIYSGIHDSVVKRPAVNATNLFFEKMHVPAANLKYETQVASGHALITPSQGNECADNKNPYISHCTVDGVGYDQAGAILQHIYGAKLNSPVKKPAGKIIEFNQSAYAPEDTGMAKTAFLYVPKSCTAADAHCKVHVALHGCGQAAETVHDKFYTETGYNNWADSNDLLVLYPQVNKTGVVNIVLGHPNLFPLNPENPNGCWDWWGYTGKDYAVKKSSQMTAIMKMVGQLQQPR